MEIEVKETGKYTEIKLNGRLDINTSPELDKTFSDILNIGKEDLIIDFTDLVYISSSGLRVFLVAAKTLDEKGKKLNFYGMKDFIKEVFDIAGFSILFNISDSKDELIK